MKIKITRGKLSKKANFLFLMIPFGLILATFTGLLMIGSELHNRSSFSSSDIIKNENATEESEIEKAGKQSLMSYYESNKGEYKNIGKIDDIEVNEYKYSFISESSKYEFYSYKITNYDEWMEGNDQIMQEPKVYSFVDGISDSDGYVYFLNKETKTLFVYNKETKEVRERTLSVPTDANIGSIMILNNSRAGIYVYWSETIDDKNYPKRELLVYSYEDDSFEELLLPDDSDNTDGLFTSLLGQLESGKYLFIENYNEVELALESRLFFYDFTTGEKQYLSLDKSRVYLGMYGGDAVMLARDITTENGINVLKNFDLVIYDLDTQSVVKTYESIKSIDNLYNINTFLPMEDVFVPTLIKVIDDEYYCGYFYLDNETTSDFSLCTPYGGDADWYTEYKAEGQRLYSDLLDQMRDYIVVDVTSKTYTGGEIDLDTSNGDRCIFTFNDGSSVDFWSYSLIDYFKGNWGERIIPHIAIDGTLSIGITRKAVYEDKLLMELSWRDITMVENDPLPKIEEYTVYSYIDLSTLDFYVSTPMLVEGQE